MNVITICYQDNGTNCFWVMLNRKLQSVTLTKAGAEKQAKLIMKELDIDCRVEYTTAY